MPPSPHVVAVADLPVALFAVTGSVRDQERRLPASRVDVLFLTSASTHLATPPKSSRLLRIRRQPLESTR